MFSESSQGASLCSCACPDPAGARLCRRAISSTGWWTPCLSGGSGEGSSSSCREFCRAGLTPARDDRTGAPVPAVRDHRRAAGGGLRAGQLPRLAVVAVAGRRPIEGDVDGCRFACEQGGVACTQPLACDTAVSGEGLRRPGRRSRVRPLPHARGWGLVLLVLVVVMPFTPGVCGALPSWPPSCPWRSSPASHPVGRPALAVVLCDDDVVWPPRYRAREVMMISSCRAGV